MRQVRNKNKNPSQVMNEENRNEKYDMRKVEGVRPRSEVSSISCESTVGCELSTHNDGLMSMCEQNILFMYHRLVLWELTMETFRVPSDS